MDHFRTVGNNAMTEHYYRLRNYALNHPECSAIMHLID